MEYSFKKFQKDAIIRFLALNKYKIIRKKINDPKVNLSNDVEFQKTFDAFFRVRRGKTWRRKYYKYFESVKNNKDIEFKDIIWHMYKETGYIEASFSSKMLASINPDMPIWDQFIVGHYKIKVSGKEKEEQIKSIIDNYDLILKKEKIDLKREDIEQTIADFKEEFKEYNLSDIKVLDYILWNDRDEDNEKNI